MSFLPDSMVYFWLFPIGMLSVWLANMGISKSLAKRKTIVEIVANSAKKEIRSVELWLRKSGTKNIVLMP
jgi:hypothetical protein